MACNSILGFELKLWKLRIRIWFKKIFSISAIIIIIIIIINYWLVGPQFKSRQGQNIFHIFKAPSPALEFTQPPVQWAQEFFRRG